MMGPSRDRVVANAEWRVRNVIAAALELEPRTHPAYGVVAVLDGKISGSVGGGAVIAAAGETVLVDAGRAHAVTAQACDLVFVELGAPLFDELLVEIGWYRAGAAPLFRASVVADPAILGIARSLADELAVERPGQRAMLDALARQLAVYLVRAHMRVRHVPDVELSRVGPVDRRLRRAIELMHDRCGDELSLRDLAASVFLAEHYFAHLFKDVTGLTPHAYLASLRIERARALLTETETPITEIASQVGYRSPSHFAHAFRAATGTSPRSYRAASILLPGARMRRTVPSPLAGEG